jgi:hypothetical protein
MSHLSRPIFLANATVKGRERRLRFPSFGIKVAAKNRLAALGDFLPIGVLDVSGNMPQNWMASVEGRVRGRGRRAWRMEHDYSSEL